MAAVMGWGLRTLRVLDRREQTEERRSWRFELSFFFSGLLILLLSLLLPAKNASVSPSVQVPRLLCSGTNLVLKLGTTAAPKHPAGTEPGRAAGVSPGLLQRARSSLGLRVRTGSHCLPSPLRPPGHPSPGRLARTGCSHQRDPGIREPRSCRQDPTCHAPLPPPLRSAAPLLAPLRPGRTPLCMHAPRHTLTRSQLCSAGSCTAHRVCTTHRAHSARPAARTRRGDVALGDMANGSVGMGWRLDLMMLGVFSNCKDSMTRCDSTKSNSELMPLGADIGHSCMDLKHTAQSPVGVQQPTLHCPCIAPGVLQPQTCHKHRAHPRRPQHPQPRQAPRGTQGS